jgi:hypothetical protein
MTAKEISDRILRGLDDDPASPGSVAPDPLGGPVPPEILAAITEGQELFAFLTLCLETTASLTLVTATTFTNLRTVLPDLLCPLKLTISGVRVRPATLAQLDAENESWQAVSGTPARYCPLGFDYIAITPQPPGPDITAQITYARTPVRLIADQFPEIPERFHQSLVKYGKYKVKLKEGAQALSRALVPFGEFLDDAEAHGDYVRARSRAARYDTLPFELSLFDRSRLMDAAAKGKFPRPQ